MIAEAGGCTSHEIKIGQIQPMSNGLGVGPVSITSVMSNCWQTPPETGVDLSAGGATECKANPVL